MNGRCRQPCPTVVCRWTQLKNAKECCKFIFTYKQTESCCLSNAPAYMPDSLRPMSEIVACRCLHSADTTTLQVPSTHRATLGDPAFPVAAARAWNSLPLETRACSSLLTFRRETKSHLFLSVICLMWRRLLQWSANVCIELCNSFRCRFCKVSPQLCDGSTVIHDICSSSSSSSSSNACVHCFLINKSSVAYSLVCYIFTVFPV